MRFPSVAPALQRGAVGIPRYEIEHSACKELQGIEPGHATRQAAEGYNSAFWLVLSIVAACVICGIGVGIYLVRDLSNGIAAIVKPMQALGSGDLSAEVTRRGEKTEIGAMADALQVFKDALITKKAADEAAARDAEAKIERGRRVDGITRQFEAMIGEIVDTVSSASTELEASASTLTATAERAQELATTVADRKSVV